jgi:Tetratricopeptide repeat
LVILDNVDDVSVVNGLLPSTESGHTLITSRVSDARLIPAEGMEVSVLDETEAIELLLRSSNNIDETNTIREARRIVWELGRLPLAIEQAAAFIRLSDIYTFLDIFRSNRTHFLAEQPHGNHSYPYSISATWSVSFARLSPETTTFAELLSFLNPDEILLEFLEAGDPNPNEILHQLMNNKFLLIKILGELQSFSFINVWDHGKRISIHRLVQSVIRESISPDTRLSRQHEILHLSSKAFQYSVSTPDIHPKNRSRYRRFLPQITAILSNLDPEIYEHFAQSPLSESIAAFLFDEGQRKECEFLNIRLLEIRTRILGPNHPDTLRIARGLASAYTTTNNVPQGIRLFEDTLQRQIQVLGESHPETLWTKHSLAVTYSYDTLRYPASFQLLKETYEGRSQVLGRDNFHTLMTKYFFGKSWYLNGHPEIALQILEECLVAQHRILGEGHEDTLRTMWILATVCANCGGIERARSSLREIWIQRVKSRGEKHWSTLSSKSELDEFESRY